MLHLDPAFDPVMEINPAGNLEVSLPNLPEDYRIHSVEDNSVPAGEPMDTEYNYLLFVHTDPSQIDPAQPHVTRYTDLDGNGWITVWIVDGTDGATKGKKKCPVPVRPDRG